MARMKIVFEGEGATELGSILKVIDSSISALQSSDDIMKLTIRDFLDRQAERLLIERHWRPEQ